MELIEERTCGFCLHQTGLGFMILRIKSAVEWERKRRIYFQVAWNGSETDGIEIARDNSGWKKEERRKFMLIRFVKMNGNRCLLFAHQQMILMEKFSRLIGV